jgi:hypothetical protein
MASWLGQKRFIHVSLCLGVAVGSVFGGPRLEVREGLPIVNGVYVNGHGPYRFLVDTGTNSNLIEANLAQSIGLRATFRTELASATGVRVVPGDDGIKVSIGSAKAEGQQFLFLRLEAIHDRWPDVQGVLGQWFLSQFDYTLDLRGRRLEFSKQDPNGTRVPFTMMNGRPIVATSLGDLVLDSGAVRLVLFGVQPDALADNWKLRTVAGSQEIGMVFSKPLLIGGRRIWRGDAVAVPQIAEEGVSGLLPLSLFKAVYVCNSEGYLIFE